MLAAGQLEGDPVQAFLRLNFKFFWAPLLDRYLPPILGRRRGWILIFQACLAICIGVMGTCSPTKELYVLGILALLNCVGGADRLRLCSNCRAMSKQGADRRSSWIEYDSF